MKVVTEEATHEYEAQKKHAAEEKQKRMEVKEGLGFILLFVQQLITPVSPLN